jgi:hypothetical protein
LLVELVESQIHTFVITYVSDSYSQFIPWCLFSGFRLQNDWWRWVGKDLSQSSQVTKVLHQQFYRRAVDNHKILQPGQLISSWNLKRVPLKHKSRASCCSNTGKRD